MMENRLLDRLGRALMKAQRLRIVIIDDAPAYFSDVMLRAAASAGYPNIRRLYKIDDKVFAQLHRNPPDIVIIDVVGTVHPAIAKDGLDVAASLYRNTRTYVVVTSAHQYHLRKEMKANDFILEERNLTAVDFIGVLSTITQGYIRTKLKVYHKLVFKLGFNLAKRFLLPNGIT
jgi:hypothetical protein